MFVLPIEQESVNDWQLELQEIRVNCW